MIRTALTVRAFVPRRAEALGLLYPGHLAAFCAGPASLGLLLVRSLAGRDNRPPAEDPKAI